MQFKQQQLQHLGIIAGICNEIGLIDRIDTKIEKKEKKSFSWSGCTSNDIKCPWF